MATETLLAFFASALVLAVAPGPDNVFVMTQAALHGRKAGLSVVLGLCSGLTVHTAAVALGVAVIFQRSQLAFDLLKFAGASYLLYLAWGAFRAKPGGLTTNTPETGGRTAPVSEPTSAGMSKKSAPSPASVPSGESTSSSAPATADRADGANAAAGEAAYSARSLALTSGALFRRGVIMNITNPKVSIFFLAFLPQFVDQKLGNVSAQIMVLGALFMLAALLVFSLMAIITARLGERLRQSARAQTLMNRMAGMVFIILALSLVMSSR